MKLHLKSIRDSIPIFVWLVTGIIALLAVAAVFIDSLVKVPAFANAAAILDPSLARVNKGNNPDALVHVVVFGDYECPNTKTDWPMIQSIRRSYGDQINLVYWQFPSNRHLNARAAALAAYCADIQNQFWEYSDLLFEHQNRLQQPDLVTYAKQLGLDTHEFSVCLGSDAAAQNVEDAVIGALGHGIKGTPTYIINGRRFEGVQEEVMLRNIIDAALKAVEE